MTTNAHKLQNYQISVKKKRITPKTIKTIECVKFTNHHSLITNHKSPFTTSEPKGGCISETPG